MSNLNYKPTYQRYLPHYQPPGAILFVTFRLARSLPAAVIDQLRKQAEAEKEATEQIRDPEQRRERAYEIYRRQFGRWDAALDTADTGPRWLEQPEVASIIADSLHYLDGEMLDLDCYCIMANHVHVVFTPLEETPNVYYGLSRIMHSLKRYTASKANKQLGRRGRFWQREYYDHVIRDEAELNRIRKYVLNNPVKAGLVETAEAWQWSFAQFM